MMYDDHLERGILSAMQYDEQSRAIYLQLLRSEHFSQANQRAFQRYHDGEENEQLDIRDALTGNHEYYAVALSEQWTKRQIFDGCGRIAKEIKAGAGLDEIIPAVESLQRDYSLESTGRGLTLRQVDALQEEDRSFQPMNTSYDYQGMYDHAGSHKGQTEVIFGHPKHGKTVYAVHRAAGYLKAGYRGLYVTMEDTYIRIRKRIGSQLGNDTPYLDKMILADRSIGTRTLDDIVTFLRYHKIVDSIDFAVIDYLQRVPVKGLSTRDEVAKVIEVSNRITDLANELDLLVLLLAQPHRIEKTRTGWNQFPDVADLYGSSAIEKDAFVATAVFRPNQVETLCNYDHTGRILSVRDWEGHTVDANSVYVRQRLNREAERCTPILHLVHSDRGLQLYAKQEHEKSKP